MLETKAAPSSRNKMSAAAGETVVKSLQWSLATAIAVSVALEFSLGYGSPALIATVILALLWSIRARKHDNIPMNLDFRPYFGHTIGPIRNWDIFLEKETEACLEAGEEGISCAGLLFAQNQVTIS